MRYQYALTNRLGNRANNQDRCVVRHGNGTVLLVVADGMGGHARGELAAQAAVDVFSREFKKQRGLIADPQSFLTKTMEQAHEQVADVGMAQHPPVDPRTTCVACLVQENKAWWVHVGDSRLYLLRGTKIVTRTRDHAYVEELIQSGAISEAEAQSHPMRNSVTQCLGGATTSPDSSAGCAEHLQEGDCLLLCSDGLWAALPEQRLMMLCKDDDLNKALEELAEDAERTSYPHSDNISAVSLRWLGHSSQATEEAPAQFELPPDEPEQDPLEAAIDEIERAIEQYADELVTPKK